MRIRFARIFRSTAWSAALVLSVLTLALLVAAETNVAPEGEIPSRLILTWSGDPAHTQHVTWRTPALLSAAQAQIAPFTANPDFAADVRLVDAAVSRVELPGGKTAGHYAAEFSGLKPGAQYCYRVGNGRAWSEWNVFRTADEKPAPFRFLYIGDIQTDIKSLWSRAIRVAFQRAPDARMIVMAGDLVSEGPNDDDWAELCTGLGFISATVPLVPVPGNHDVGRPDNQPTLRIAALWRQHFGLPHNGPQDFPELDQQAYYLDYQGVRFICVDANVFDNPAVDFLGRERIRDRELVWLEATLRDNPNRWTIVMQHQPVYPIVRDRVSPEMEKLLVPLYEKHKVSLVLQGHDHAYGRIQRNGVTYVTSVSGPKMGKLSSPYLPKMAKAAANTQMYQVVEVNSERLALKAYAIDGNLIDAFEVRRP
jgi:3',5'-cyclic AMP phosphodiesterase CpdA